MRGPKIGLIVSKGHERDLYGERGDSPILGKVIADNNIIGITNSNGPEILAAVRSLLEGGVRRICISLKGGLQNPESERQIKHVLEEQYPDHFLGSVPVLTGSDICQNGDDMEKSNPEAGLKGTRPAYWPDRQDFTPTKVYSFERLRPGNLIAGPAIVEGEYTTMVIPFPLRFSIDEHGLGILE